jgi:hypothetical protein
VGFATSLVVCQAPSCTNGVAQLEARCDGRGSCATDGATKTCEPFACGATDCKDTCASDADCAANYTCDTPSSKCVASGKCDGAHTVTSADGKRTTDCAPYACESSGRCKTACGTTDDCVPGALCNDGRCAAAPSTSTQSGGGCTTSRAPLAAMGWSAALAALGAVARRRRRNG